MVAEREVASEDLIRVVAGQIFWLREVICTSGCLFKGMHAYSPRRRIHSFDILGACIGLHTAGRNYCGSGSTHVSGLGVRGNESVTTASPRRDGIGMECVFWERQRRYYGTPNPLMHKHCSASGRHLRPRSVGLLIPASQVRILPGTPSPNPFTASDCGFFISPTNHTFSSASPRESGEERPR